MFIDRSYFIGDINIPNSESDAVGQLLDYYIQKYEPEFLRRLLGSAAYSTMLTVDIMLPENEKWFNLVRGADFTYGGTQFNYFGLAPVGDITSGYVSNPAINIYFTVDGAGGPASNQAVYVNATLAGRDYTVFKSGYGVLVPGSHISIDEAGGFTYTNGELFSTGAEYAILVQASTGLVTVPGNDGLKESPIANYVYYWFMRNLATQTTTGGNVKTANENSVTVSGGHKMEKAWNEISKWEYDFWRYVQTSPLLYTFPFYGYKFPAINEYNL